MGEPCRSAEEPSVLLLSQPCHNSLHMLPILSYHDIPYKSRYPNSKQVPRIIEFLMVSAWVSMLEYLCQSISPVPPLLLLQPLHQGLQPVRLLLPPRRVQLLVVHQLDFSDIKLREIPCCWPTWTGPPSAWQSPSHTSPPARASRTLSKTRRSWRTEEKCPPKPVRR